MTETPPVDLKDQSDTPTSVIIRPWPKVVFLYPTLLMGLVCWIVQMIQGYGSDEGPEALGNSTLGSLYVLVFCLNMLIFAFDFSRVKSVTLVVAIVAIVLGLGWASESFDFSNPLRGLLNGIDVQMNNQFYGLISGFYVIVMVIMLINTRFNYFEMNHREIIHHQGYLGDINRLPTTGLRLHKEISDIFEFVLL
ncbi:MAG: hypothetical protein AAF196_18780, partial [Planctomycetota bacterium]